MLDNTGDQSDVMSPLIELGSLLANMPLDPIYVLIKESEKGEQIRGASTHLHTVQGRLLAQHTVSISKYCNASHVGLLSAP